MPQATAGEEFNENTYSYTVPITAADVQSFYSQKMEELGWTSPFGFQTLEEGGIMLFQMRKTSPRLHTASTWLASR